MAELVRFLTDEANIDASVAAYVTKQLQLESVADFANYWTRDEYERGMQDDIISQLELFRSKPAGKLQVARLRAAWQGAQQQMGAAPALKEAAPVAPADPQMGICEKTGLEAGGTSKGGTLNAAQVAHLGEGTFKDGLHKPKWDSEGLHKPHTIGGKTYETGFHYLLEAHELGGKNADGGYGGHFCLDPYSKEISDLCTVLLSEAQQDKTLCYNNFTDPCPQLTQRQVELCKGFDYGDKTLKLPCGPLPWPAGCPHPGYVPKTNPLNGRWITISGGQKEFIKTAIDTGMLGAAEARKIMADTDHEKTGGMYLRINQRGDTCTVDASVAKYARAKRTWRSGHYFYEPLVSGGNLLGVWVLPEEYRKIGFFWEMDSGKCFRIERRAFQRNGLMILRQATEVAGKISFVFYVKVSNDPESQIIPVQSRDYTALAGHDNAPDNLGNPYPCTAKDLDFPVKRDTWLDKNESEMIKQRNMVGSAFAHCCEDGFEAHDDTQGGPVNAAQVEALGKEHFKDGLHQPKFHEEGLHKPMEAGGKVYTTGFHYLLEAHELGGKNADGGYGGPLCQDPYGDEVQRIVENLLAQSEIDRTLAYNNFKDPCPELTKEQVAKCKGFDYGDKTLKLPCGPLPWPAGCPHPEYVPKTNPLTGRWITVSGGQAAFIKEAIKSGMLGASESKKILSDTDHEKTGGMYLRISQFGNQCTVDASIAKYARAKRTWRSGHYFYEPLVSGGNLLGVWVLPEEYRKIGFFWEMDSGKCFRIERRAYPVGPYMFLRQSTEVAGKISFVFYVKVDNDPGSKPIPVQSRDYTALAGQDNVPDNLGNPYPCTAQDLDYPKKRDTWLDTNKEAMLDQRQQVGVVFAKVCEKGFEVSGDAKGGPVNGKQIEKYGDNFKNGLHQPTFHPEGPHKEMEVNGKKYDSAFHYLLECHELGGKNEDGGYGGPLCKDPYGPEVSALVEKLLKEAEDDRTLCYNNFQDPCPELPKEQVAKCKGFDYGDKTLKLPCGPLPWPAGCPEPGYVPKTNPLHGRWITVSGGQAAFIKEAIKSGMLGQAEAHKIMADTDHQKTGGMYLRINQFGDQCTVDASVAKYARAKRTWRSGHYFYEPLVSGGNLLGVWVLPEEYRKIGFFWEMESGKCFRIERRAFQAGPYTFLRQSTEVAGKISFVLYVKVSNDPGSEPIPVQSRDYTALAGCDNVCTNLGKPYPSTAKDLDYPKKRDAWLDQNKRQMLYQRDVVASTFKAGATQ
uniref:Luciferase n=2 Tax=Alexandrium tamarense TaxID=2926 RepID=Q5UAZ6_ALETA|nr:luciferase [Alexandrium tamarense]